MELLSAAALERCGIRSDARVLLALSGGADSVALLLLLQDALREGRIGELAAAHFHHGLRDAADADERFCAALCDQLRIPFYSARGDVHAAAQASDDGIEAAARRLRYAFLRKVKAEIGADCIVTAHHADDQAETVLLHLLRGSAGKGLCGMRPRSGDVARPLLSITHAQLCAFLAERGQTYCPDETNDDVCYTRNRVRKELLPQLETYNPRVREAICTMANLLAEDEAYFAAETECLLQKAASDGGYLRELLLAAPRPVRSRALLQLLQRHGTAGYSRADAEKLDALLTAQAGTVFELRGGYAAWNDGPILCLGKRPAQDAYCRPIAVGENCCVNGWRICCEYTDAYRAPQSAMEAYLCLDAFAGGTDALLLRSKRDGDRFRPLGCAGTKLVSDVYIDRKYAKRLRQAPLLFCGEELLFVPGYTIAEAARVTENSKTIIHFKVEEDAGV